MNDKELAERQSLIAFHRRRRTFIANQLDGIEFRGKTVLDLGCWGGHWAFDDAERRGARRVLSTDDPTQNWPASAGFLLSKDLPQSSINANLDFSVYDLDILAEKFDIILCLGLYDHLVDPLYAFAQIRHRCHENTLVVFEGDTTLGLPPNLMRYDLASAAMPYFTPTPQGLKQMLQACYFNVESQALMNNKPVLSERHWLEVFEEVARGNRELPERMDRLVTIACPFVGDNTLHNYRPPFGLHTYDPRFSESYEDLLNIANDEDFVRSLYRKILHREAEHDGLVAYVEELRDQSRRRVIQIFLLSDERRERSKRLANTTPDYNAWIERDEVRLAEECPLLVEHIEQMLYTPIFVILVETFTGGLISETIASIEKQIYSRWRVHLIQSETWADANNLPEGDFVVPVRAGDTLSPVALYEFANALNTSPDMDMIYADEDRVVSTGQRGEPFYKPDWSPDYLETFNYVGYPACFRRYLVGESCLFGGGYYGFVLRFSECTQKISHLRKILCHRSDVPFARNSIQETLELRALTARLQRSGRSGEVRRIANCSSGWDVRLTVPSNPLVSIVIPTAGKIIAREGRDFDLVIHCVSSIDRLSTYRHFEIILVDNGDISETRRGILSRLGCKFITYTEPVFNIAKKLNLGVSEANGEFLLLMNDDMEIITPEWIERMLEHFMKDHVGVVGVKLLYPNGTIQHAGVVHYCGNPDHVRRGFDRYDPGYFLSTSGVRNYSAVTGACTMVRSETYRTVSGYTEALPENFNDIDFCQKVRAMGLYIVYTPHVELTHFESQSREPRLLPGEVNYYQERWARETAFDPFYNEYNLTVAPPTFVPVVNKRLL